MIIPVGSWREEVATMVCNPVFIKTAWYKSYNQKITLWHRTRVNVYWALEDNVVYGM